MSNARKLANLMVGTELKVSGVDSDLSNTVNVIKSRLDSDDSAIQNVLTSFENKISSIKTRLDSDDTKLQSLNTALAAGIINLVDSDLITTQIQSKINSIVTNIDSDSTALQSANSQIALIKSRLDSDSTAIQAIATIADTASRAGGVGDSDLKVVADLRNELDSEILYVRNLTLTYTSFIYTATAGQTSFSGNDDNSVTLYYTAGSILVFLNGIKLEAEDFTATDGTTIVLADPAGVSNELNIICPKLESNYIAPIVIDWGAMRTHTYGPKIHGTQGSGYYGEQVALSSNGEYAAVTAMSFSAAAPQQNSQNWGGFFIYKNSSSDYSDSTKWDNVARIHELPFLSGGPAGATFSGLTNFNNMRFGKAPIWINEDASKVVIPHVPTGSASSTWAMFVLNRNDSDFTDYASFNPYSITTDVGSTQNMMVAGLANTFAVTPNLDRIAYHMPKVESSIFLGGVVIVKRTGSTFAKEAQFDTNDAKSGAAGSGTGGNHYNAPGMGGNDIVMNADGDKVVCSSVNGASGGDGRGAIWTMTRSGTTWSMPNGGTIYNPQNNNDGYGKNISMSSDGLYLAVNVEKLSSSTTYNKVIIYEWNAGTSAWDVQATIIPGAGAADPSFTPADGNRNCKLNSDGSILSFVSFGDDDSDNAQSNSSLIRIYKRSGSTWSFVNHKYGTDLFQDFSNYTTNFSTDHAIKKLAMSDTGATIIAGASGLINNLEYGNSNPGFGLVGILHDK